MKRLYLAKSILTIHLLFFCSFVLAETTNIDDVKLADIACQYEIKTTSKNKSLPSEKKSWYFWRKDNMIQTRDADGDYGEIWNLTANGSIQYRKLYPMDKTAVEYMPGDRIADNMDFDWFKLSSMLTKQEIDALKLVKKTHFLGRQAELREGKIGDQRLKLLWLPKEKLPARIIRTNQLGSTELRLIAISPLETAAWKPFDTNEISDFRHIDAVDFGDMETDPFVKKIMSKEGHHHH